MKYLVFVLIALSQVNVWACPDLTGHFQCWDSKFQISQTIQHDNVVSYHIDGQTNKGEIFNIKIVTDGQPHVFNSSVNSEGNTVNKYRIDTCSNNKLNSQEFKEVVNSKGKVVETIANRKRAQYINAANDFEFQIYFPKDNGGYIDYRDSCKRQ